MTDPNTGLPADSLAADGTRSVQTSTTNIGAYMWSTLVAEQLDLIRHREAVKRIDQTLRSLETMERHQPSGQFYNWYDHTNGQVLTVWPPSGDPVVPILSSVDNGWLATALHIVANSVPELSARAEALFDSMHLASITGRMSIGSCSTTRRAQGHRPAAMTRSSAKAGSPAISGSQPARSQQRVLWRMANLP